MNFFEKFAWSFLLNDFQCSLSVKGIRGLTHKLVAKAVCLS